MARLTWMQLPHDLPQRQKAIAIGQKNQRDGREEQSGRG
jgi:hypothetical protein